MNWFLYILVFVLGSLFGSFLNCAIYRLHQGKSFLRGRSFCPHCKKTIDWRDNITLLGFVCLKGRCRYCLKGISWQYPLVELTTAVIFLITFLVRFSALDFNLLSFAYLDILIILRDWIFASFLLIIFIYDLKYYLILDKVSFPAMAVALILNLVISFSWSSLWSYLLAALICGGFFLIQFLVSRGKWIGGGDIRVGFLMGFMLGFPIVLVALFLAYIFGAIIGSCLLLTGKKKMQSQIPFGTFLSLATLIALLFGQSLLNHYLSIL